VERRSLRSSSRARIVNGWIMTRRCVQSREIMTTLLLTERGALLVKSKEPVGISEFESRWSRA
jgi:hypothetical protein